MQKTFSFQLKGGLDLVTPAAVISPGKLIGAKNYEPDDEGGYRRLFGYERYDGLPSPSKANYWLLNFDAGTGAALVIEDIVTGGTSGATSEVLSVTLTSGTWGVDAVGFLVVFDLLGVYEDGENLESGGVRAVMDGIALQRGSTDDADDETYQRAAIEATRDDIGKIPGADDINGVWVYNDRVYAFRDDVGSVTVTSTGISFANPDTIVDSGAGFGIFSPGDRVLISGSTDNNTSWTVDAATASTLTVTRADNVFIITESSGPSITIAKVDQAKMWESSPSGWVQIALGNYLDFTSGTAEFLEGETITGGSSSATATIVGIGVTSGSWTAGTAAGRIYIGSVTSGPFQSETITSAVGSATCSGAEVAVTLPRGGKYEFQNYNFFGTLQTLSMWAVNQVGRGFRYNSVTGFAHVHVTGLSDSIDKPEHLEAHKKHLFFSIGSSVQHSSVGFPMVWNAITGAAEIATGDRVVSLDNQPGDILGIFNRNRTYLLYGDDVDNWDLVNFSLERGAIEWTVQDMGYAVYHDDRGIHTLQQTDAYGDLAQDSISTLVNPLVQEGKSLIVDSVRIKTKDQYRVYYSNKTGLLVRFDTNNRREFMPFELNHEIKSICSEEDGTGLERVFFGSIDGYVYEAEVGESFDGQVIDHHLRLAFCHCRTPRQEKRFHKATLQIDGPDDPGMTYAPEYDYGSPDIPDVQPASSVTTDGGIWGIDFWGDFVWDGALVGESEAYIQGVGINISLLLQASTNYERTHTVQGCTFNYSMRAVRR